MFSASPLAEGDVPRTGLRVRTVGWRREDDQVHLELCWGKPEQRAGSVHSIHEHMPFVDDPGAYDENDGVSVAVAILVLPYTGYMAPLGTVRIWLAQCCVHPLVPCYVSHSKLLRVFDRLRDVLEGLSRLGPVDVPAKPEVAERVAVHRLLSPS